MTRTASRSSSRMLPAALAATAAAAMLAIASPARAQVVIGNWENPADVMDGWFDWQGRGIYSQDTYGATLGSRSLKLLTADDGGSRWAQTLAIRLHNRGFIDEFLTSGQLAIDVSWRLSDWVGGDWSQVENLSLNSNNPGFTDLGRATIDTHQMPPWNGSWDTTNFGDDTRTLTWDMSAFIDGDLGNGEVTAVPAASNGGYLELIFATNYDTAFDPSTAAFYFDNARLLPRIVSSEWTGAGADPDNDAGNGNAATGNWFSSTNWTHGVPGVADSVATFGTNGGAITTPQTVTTDSPLSLGTLIFDNSAGYTINGSGTITMDAAAGPARIGVQIGAHSIANPIAADDDLTVNVLLAGSSLATPNLQPTTHAISKGGAGTWTVNSIRAAGLSVGGGRLVTTGASSHVGTLTVSSGAWLDLADNDLVVTSGSLTQISNLIAQSRSGGTWDAPGITSSAARTQPSHATTLGVLSGAEYIAMTGTTFGEFTVAPSDVLVKYTWYGDTDFNGIVNFDDYVRTDNGFNNHLSGWANGDFDLNHVVNFDDYVLIDLAFNTQSGTLGRAIAFLDGSDRSLADMTDPALAKVVEHLNDFGDAYARGLLSAVPEPAAIALLAVPAVAGAVRRRRSHPTRRRQQ